MWRDKVSWAEVWGKVRIIGMAVILVIGTEVFSVDWHVTLWLWYFEHWVALWCCVQYLCTFVEGDKVAQYAGMHLHKRIVDSHCYSESSSAVICVLSHGDCCFCPVAAWAVWMTNLPPSVLWHCWLGHQTCKNHRPYNLYCVGADVKPCSINQCMSSDNGHMLFGTYRQTSFTYNNIQIFPAHPVKL